MTRSKVFISYNHDDAKALEQLRRFLRPMERRGLIDFWDDTRIEPGNDWAAEIDAALDGATAAVLLVSQDFLDSSFITDEEIPRILSRADAGKLTVLPVFLKPSQVGDLEFTFHDTAGREHREKLTKLQGYGTPSKTLADLSWSDRERVYQKLSHRISTLSGEPAVAPRRVSRHPRVTREPARLHVLTVDLKRLGEQLHVHYLLPGMEPFAAATVAWSAFYERLRKLHRSLDEGWIPPETGEVLFDLLFGSEKNWEPILRTLFGRQEAKVRPNPPWAPVRVRVATDDPFLITLPWRLATWSDRSLVGDRWVFLTTGVADPLEDHTTTAPSNVLIVAPERDDRGEARRRRDGHAEAVADVLKNIWPTGREARYVRVATTREEIVRALSGMRPHLLYVYARGRVERKRLVMLLADEEALSTEDLCGLFRDAGHRPHVVYLNTTGSGEPGPLLAEVPLVVWRRRPEWENDSTTLALNWMRRWLGDGEDPVKALHAVTRDDMGMSLEAATLMVHASYRSWKTTVYQVFDQKRLPRLRLDRDHQKALVSKHVLELARSDTRRVMGLVAYAAPGNSVSFLHQQLRDFLLVSSDVAEINWLRLEFPETRSRPPRGGSGGETRPPRGGSGGQAQLRRDLEYELKLQLDAGPDEPVPHLLRRHAPRVVEPGKRAVLWLDWGTCGDGHQPSLTPPQLEAWVRFSSEFLSFHCPDDLRLVSYVTLETKPSKHKRLEQSLKEHRRQPWCRRSEFRLSVLPPLGKVAEEDLFDFLEDARNSSCEPAIHAEVAERLVTATEGEFEATVALMEKAEKGSWYDLLDQLRREQGVELPENDEEPF